METDSFSLSITHLNSCCLFSTFIHLYETAVCFTAITVSGLFSVIMVFVVVVFSLNRELVSSTLFRFILPTQTCDTMAQLIQSFRYNRKIEQQIELAFFFYSIQIKLPELNKRWFTRSAVISTKLRVWFEFCGLN